MIAPLCTCAGGWTTREREKPVRYSQAYAYLDPFRTGTSAQPFLCIQSPLLPLR